MAEFTGFMHRPDDETVRFFDRTDPTLARDVALADVAEYRGTDEDNVAILVVNDGAPIAERRLDDDEFRALFTAEGRPTDEFLRGSSYPDHYSWNPPEGGGIC